MLPNKGFPVRGPLVPAGVRRLSWIGIVRSKMPAEQKDPTPTRLILERLKGGEGDLFAILLGRYWTRTLLMIEANLGAELRASMDAEDVAQEAWIRVHRGIGGFEYRGDGSFFAWLGSIVRNLIVDLARRERAAARQPGEGRSVIRETAADGAPGFILEDLAAVRTSPSGLVARSEAFQKLREAIRGLPPREREVVSLRFLDELPVKETAGALGISENAVKAATFRGMQALQEVLAGAEGLV
jgi:RNA polymerase sigma-70 factor (ECF subfamily)